SPAPLGEVRIDDEPAPVYLFSQDAPTTVAEIEELPVPTDDGPVPLETLAEVTEDVQPASVTRQDGDRTATVQVTPAGQDLTAVNAALEATIDDLDLAPGVELTIGGVSADQAEAFADLGVALLAAILIVYIVMVATFNSLLQPFILMVSVPFAATGALLALLLTGTPLGVAALVGVLMLVGIVVTNAIVLIDLVNQYRQRGMSLWESVTEGARMRLRPIVMTAAATILALMPMALGLTGGGAFISQPLALVVIGGLISSTLLTLVLVPVLYTLVERGKLRGQERRRRRAERGGRRRTATA
ncbi:efflux RND transporter permease subunit, partial [Georgenia sp. 10Sc9-8]|nr:efflux RND transporter permease subunit [Georgenia halotolerans]